MSSRSVEMREVDIPLHAIQGLSSETRYSYYVLGHIFNELIFLQKLIGFSIPKHDDDRHVRRLPEIGQTMFLCRMASSKIWEAILTLRRDPVNGMMRTLIFPEMEEGSKRFHELGSAINAAPWLKPVRDGIGFHFPTFDKWKEHTTPDDEWDNDRVYVGEQTGNTYYASADAIAQTWMFNQYGAMELKDAVVPLIDQMIDLLKSMNSLLEDMLGVFIGKVLLQGEGVAKTAGKVVAPEHDRISIPFWTYMKAGKA